MRRCHESTPDVLVVHQTECFVEDVGLAGQAKAEPSEPSVVGPAMTAAMRTGGLRDCGLRFASDVDGDRRHEFANSRGIARAVPGRSMRLAAKSCWFASTRGTDCQCVTHNLARRTVLPQPRAGLGASRTWRTARTRTPWEKGLWSMGMPRV